MPDWAALWRSVETAIAAGDAGAEERAVAAIQDSIREGEPMSLDACSSGFSLLRRHRRFDCLVDFGDLFGFESPSPRVRKLAIQGLIDTKKLDRAIRELEKTRAYIAERVAAANPQGSVDDAEMSLEFRQEQAEVEGLLGRVYKQRCVDGAKQGRSAASRAADARKSIGYYWDAYRAAPVENSWHGINYVAVARYAQAKLDVVPPGDAPEEVARRMLRDLEQLESRGLMTVWDYATRGEAQLALGDVAGARESYARYLAHPSVDAFMRGSTRRQLEELWELPESHELVQLFVEVDPGKVPAAKDDGEEARFEDSPYAEPTDDPMALARGRIVARIGRNLYSGIGTGFLIDGKVISPKLEGKPLLLTCHHVCPSLVAAGDVCVMFFGPGKDRRKNIIVEYAELLWTSPRPPEGLDASLLLLGAAPFGAELPPIAAQEVKVGDRAYVIGHPWGGGKLASLERNDIREVGDPRFYYPSATDPGSSGGPVFNDEWEVAGLHRAGPKSKKMNEGVRIDRILEALRAHDWK